LLRRVPIRLKLILLAGVPVIGALILAAMIARDARRQAEGAAAIGSIEDLARLSGRMTALVHAIQFERNELSLHLGTKTLSAPALKERFAQTDTARKQLAEFLAVRSMSSLPPRLARDLKAAEDKLTRLQTERDAALAGEQRVDELLNYYAETDLSLISATAALSQLADDGQLIRAISALVAVLQIKERASQEHALLSYVFATNDFPAGTYKDFVALTTEEADYINVLRVDAADGVSRQFAAITEGPEFARAAELRKVALETMNDDYNTDPNEWSEVQGKKIERFRSMEVVLNQAIEVAALAKVRAAARAVRLSYALGGGVIALSALLAALIARGISRSVGNLSRAAEQVRKEKDFSVRAAKTSEDELGHLTDAFNEMLSGIQGRDDELRNHRENLEQLVAQRTLALQKRNEAMRLVLDNVEQGLATIELDGGLSTERSRAFDQWFGATGADDSFAGRLAHSNQKARDALKMGWDQVIDGFLPLECALDQLPRRIEIQGRHYALTYKAILDQANLRGALLVVTDVTSELERARRDSEQRELIAIFERITRDRAGFFEFFKECEGLVHDVVEGKLPTTQATMRAVHTVKGNTGMFGIASVADVAHELESFIIETGSLPSADQVAKLARAWKALSDTVERFGGREQAAVVPVAEGELQELEEATAARVPHAQLSELIARLRLEHGAERLKRVGEQAQSLAHRLGKDHVDVQVDADSQLRFQASRWAPFWSSFVHVLRNALDHGVESASEREEHGKSARAKLELVAKFDSKWLTIEARDDGRGIDWERVRTKARERGLASASEEDLVEALFHDGFSTAEGVTDISGRGVGMGAVRDATRVLGGEIAIRSAAGVGTTISFRFPLPELTRTRLFSVRPEARNVASPVSPVLKKPNKISMA